MKRHLPVLVTSCECYLGREISVELLDEGIKILNI